jgi:hypothetical protein
MTKIFLVVKTTMSYDDNGLKRSEVLHADTYNKAVRILRESHVKCLDMLTKSGESFEEASVSYIHNEAKEVFLTSIIISDLTQYRIDIHEVEIPD